MGRNSKVAIRAIAKADGNQPRKETRTISTQSRKGDEPKRVIRATAGALRNISPFGRNDIDPTICGLTGGIAESELGRLRIALISFPTRL
jgi:hypothetical protein